MRERVFNQLFGELARGRSNYRQGHLGVFDLPVGEVPGDQMGQKFGILFTSVADDGQVTGQLPVEREVQPIEDFRAGDSEFHN